MNGVELIAMRGPRVALWVMASWCTYYSPIACGLVAIASRKLLQHMIITQGILDK